MRGAAHMAHNGIMRTHTDLRTQYPEVEFEARPLRCADGLTRLLVLAPWYWQKLDFLLKADTPSLCDITGFCLKLARRSVSEEGWDFDAAFRELLMYYIYRNHQAYVADRHNLANDNLDDCFS